MKLTQTLGIWLAAMLAWALLPSHPLTLPTGPAGGACPHACLAFRRQDNHATVPGRQVHRLPRDLAAAGPHAHHPD